jgi:glycosyltransferase involved in cell wall biosynthesis
MKRLSVIIPIYKVEPYVERCIRSLEDQDIPRDSYELICINDGSPDNSREVVLRMKEEFGNIVLIDQENQGVSRARNNGLKQVSGEYTMMVDPDDYVLPNVLLSRLEIMDRHRLDAGFMGFTILNENMKQVYDYDPAHETGDVMPGVDLLNKFWSGANGSEERDPHRSYSILFRTSFLRDNDLSYLENVPYLEDGEFMARIMCLAERATFMKGQMYMRTTRPGSATHSPLYYTERARDGFLKAAHNLHQFKLDHCRRKEQVDFINDSIVHFTIMAITSLEPWNYLKHYSKLHRVLKKGPLKILDTDGCSDWYKKMGRYYNRSMNRFYLYWMGYRIREAIKIEVGYWIWKLRQKLSGKG